MSHPEFLELVFQNRSHGFPSGFAKGGKPFAGVRGVPASSPSFRSPPAAGSKRREQEFFGDTPAPRQGIPSAPPFFECLFQKFGVTHGNDLAKPEAS